MGQSAARAQRARPVCANSRTQRRFRPGQRDSDLCPPAELPVQIRLLRSVGPSKLPLQQPPHRDPGTGEAGVLWTAHARGWPDPARMDLRRRATGAKRNLRRGRKRADAAFIQAKRDADRGEQRLVQDQHRAPWLCSGENYSSSVAAGLGRAGQSLRTTAQDDVPCVPLLDTLETVQHLQPARVGNSPGRVADSQWPTGAKRKRLPI